jgi:hypothetical protein
MSARVEPALEAMECVAQRAEGDAGVGDGCCRVVGCEQQFGQFERG